MKTKICSKCGEELDVRNFGKLKTSKDGLAYRCKSCIKEKGKKYYKDNKEKVKNSNDRWKENNPEKVTESRKRYNEENRDKAIEYGGKYREENRDKINISSRKYKEENKEKINESNKKYRKDNIVKVNKCSRKWREENRKIARERIKKCREKNPEKEYERHKKYREENLSKFTMYAQNRRARKLLLPNTFTIEQWEECKIYFYNKCCYCGKELPLSQEHFIPVANNGGYTKENIIPSCQSCNSSKNDRNFSDWYPKHKSYDKDREKIIIEYIEHNNTELIAI